MYYNVVSDEIHHLLNVACDYEGNCVDKLAYAEARLKCLEAYKQLLPYREQINSDVDEMDGKNGFSHFYDINSPLKFRHKAKRLSRTAKEFLENVIN